MTRHDYNFSIKCPLPGDVVFKGLTDFSDQRVRYFPNLSRETYRVLDQTKTSATVIEGTGPFRTKERYDWSTKGRIWSVVVESSVLGPGSVTDIRVINNGSMACRVEGHLEREYVGSQGAVLAGLVFIQGRSRFYRKLYLRTLKNIQKASRRK